MKRLQLIELEDLPWFPGVVREGMMDCLRFFFTTLKVYGSSAPAVCELLFRAGETQVLDLCSGGGGGAKQVVEEVRKHCQPTARMVLSDLYPNLQTYAYLKNQSNGALTYIAAPVDALNVPAELPRVRTLYTAFHHFSPAQAQQLLHTAAANRCYIGIFEGTSRKWGNLLLVLPLPLLVLLATPFIQPFRWSRLLFTYVIPLIPLGVFWDGLVSMLRLYSVPELEKMTRKATIPGYHWEVRQARHWLGVKTVQVVGWPEVKNQELP